ncbi:hypothetical protein M9H77_21726 [Catharanthus roseus]|uniref:Uncharacterized protein n=1 Tax=Catharanthus roseus TaxID=4058 RepID=A0ACC0AR28_CATRO|nr:hypothetical protein M9H77_21726 [Catharanthus roseus]
MIDIQLGMRFVDKVQAVSAVRKYSVSVGREYRVLKSKIDTWTARCYHHNSSRNTHALYRLNKTNTETWSSKFISMSISHLVANDPEIPVSNIIQEVCRKWQTYTLPCSHVLACVEKMGQERILMCRRYIRDKRTEELTKRIFIRS